MSDRRPESERERGEEDQTLGAAPHAIKIRQQERGCGRAARVGPLPTRGAVKTEALFLCSPAARQFSCNSFHQSRYAVLQEMAAASGRSRNLRARHDSLDHGERRDQRSVPRTEQLTSSGSHNPGAGQKERHICHGGACSPERRTACPRASCPYNLGTRRPARILRGHHGRKRVCVRPRERLPIRRYFEIHPWSIVAAYPEQILIPRRH